HIQWKFRDEVRPRFGVMRGREFLMKDAYSFDLTPAAARHSYNKMFVAYLRTFARMGLKSIPMAAETGPIGGALSHEFIILAETGESRVYCHADLVETRPPAADVDFEQDLTALIARWTKAYAATDEKHDAARFEAEVPAEKRVTARGIEVGHIFFFGTKYSEPMGCRVQGPDGGMIAVQMGSYGVEFRVSSAPSLRRATMRQALFGRCRLRRSRSASSTSRSATRIPSGPARISTSSSSGPARQCFTMIRRSG